MSDVVSITLDVTAAWAALKSTVCACGSPKLKLQSTCRSCWNRMPRELALELWRPFSEGFLAYYRLALQWLREHKAEPEPEPEPEPMVEQYDAVAYRNFF